MYKNILFDLDGTLTDPGVGITNSVAYALEKFGIVNTDRTELYKFIGPPLQTSFKEFYGFSEHEIAQAVKYYREYYRETGIYENQLYTGIRELLQTLKENQKQIILATSKPEEFSIKILEYFDIEKYFDFVAGATMDGSRGEKADIIRYALEQNNILDLSSAIMVGDRKFDILGAAQNKIDSVGVLFGYGSKEELTDAGANYLAEQPAEILEICG
jgi:phosphoglycolate phosphatase